MNLMMSQRNEGTSAEALAASLDRYLRYTLGKTRATATKSDIYKAMALAVREFVADGLVESQGRIERAQSKRLYYLSIEFLVGRLFGNNLYNLGLEEMAREAASLMGFDLDQLIDEEYDPALGNGGLGRLAACFLDSLATLDLPGYGYGINYEYGLFKQAIENGVQIERPDHWLIDWSPWEIERPDEQVLVPVYGRVDHAWHPDGEYKPVWRDREIVVGVPYDMPIVGYGGRTVNYLRLYSARSSSDFDIRFFNEGDYIGAVRRQIETETISKVLYPEDSVQAGKELRLVQEYFLVACAIHDIIHRHLAHHDWFDNFAEKNAIQLNDTHPALAVAELMRVLVDDHRLDWETAWGITVEACGYTNHTLLPEALERWPVRLLAKVLPRHLQIIYEINSRFLKQVARRYPGDQARMAAMSLIEEGMDPHVRMAHLAMVGSHAINGVASLHTQLIKTRLAPAFFEYFPDRFHSMTNGVTPRRWLLKANPGLAHLLTEAIGEDWVTDLDQLKRLEGIQNDAGFRDRFRMVKDENKQRLAEVVRQKCHLTIDPTAMFDVQAKRIHEYKRQLMNALHLIHLYLTIVEDGRDLIVPRVAMFAGKAAPGYFMAKLIIRLINDIAAVVNEDPKVGDQLKVAFLPNYKVTLAERIIPGADLSEQISTAGYEASGTGNMKFAMNGALTIGTLDGANVEIREEVGAENIFIFGLNADEVAAHQANATYDPWVPYKRDEKVRRVMDALATGRFSPDEPGRYRPIFDALLHHGDRFFLLADLASYIDAQERVARLRLDPEGWTDMVLRNVAGMGRFSSDRTITEYARDIWGLERVRG